MARSRRDVRKVLGERVRELRRAAGFTQEDFALRVGQDRAYMGRIERGEANVTLLTMKRIADALDISIRELL